MAIGSIVVKDNPILDTDTYLDNIIPNGNLIPNSYNHEIRAIGGYWNSGFSLIQKQKEYLQDYLYNGLGRLVQSYSETGVLVWEGLITKMILRTTDKILAVSLDNMVNRVWARHLVATDAHLTKSTIKNNTDSQNRYGIKEKVLQGEVATLSLANQAAQAYLDIYANPRKPAISHTGTGQIRLDVFCSGYFTTLDWQRYNQTAIQGVQNANLEIQAIIDVGGQYVSSTQLEKNTTQISREYDRDVSSGGAITAIARAGDANNKRYIVGMYENRILVYEQVLDVDTSPELIKYAARGKSIIELGTGRKLEASEIRPNNWIKSEDVYGSQIPRSATTTQDPRLSFVEQVQYRDPNIVTVFDNKALQLNNKQARSAFAGVVQS